MSLRIIDVSSKGSTPCNVHGLDLGWQDPRRPRFSCPALAEPRVVKFTLQRGKSKEVQERTFDKAPNYKDLTETAEQVRMDASNNTLSLFTHFCTVPTALPTI